MLVFIVGLILFFGIHFVRIVAPDWRAARIAALGEGPWKGIYSLVSIIGLALIIWGFGLARDGSAQLYDAPRLPVWVSLLANMAALFLFTAANFPAGYVKRAVGHPMILGTLVWSAMHLFSNGSLVEVLLFGSFFVWASANLVSVARRPRPNPHVAGENAPGTAWWPDVASAIITLIVTWALLSFAHVWLFGAMPVAL